MINQKDSSMFYGKDLINCIHSIYSFTHTFIIAEINAMLVALHLCANRFTCCIYLFIEVICYLHLLVIYKDYLFVFIYYLQLFIKIIYLQSPGICKLKLFVKCNYLFAIAIC